MDVTSSHSHPERIGHFRIEKPLGRDAFGAVYGATDERERRSVALRVLPEAIHVDVERRDRLLADARALMGVEHDGLATVLDAGEVAEALYVASALARGRSLRTRIEEEGTLDLAEALRLASEITSALAALHRQGLVHGALTDERVILDDDGRITVTGLGLAEVVRPMMARPLDARSDVYSIGALLHEMLSGARAVTREGAIDPAPRFASLAGRSIPREIDALVARATDPDPDRRPADADALLAALARIDLPVTSVGEQVAETREAVTAGASKLWIVGASVALAAVVALAIVVVTTMGNR